VTALVRNPNSAQSQALSKMGAHLATGDITDRESMRAAMKDADMVIHSAGHYEYGMNKAGREIMHAVNITGTDNVLGLAHELKIPRTLYISTVQAFGESGTQPRDESFARQTPCRTEYERSKTEAHEIAMQYQKKGLPLIIICPNGVIGVNDYSAWGYFMRMYINRVMPPTAWSPKTTHALVHMDDITQGIMLAAEKGRIGETYILSGEAKSFREHMKIWDQRPGALKPMIWLPAQIAALMFSTLEPFQRMMGLPAFISRETVIGGATNWYYTSEKAKRELGWGHRSAESMWLAAIDGEIKLLSKRKKQKLLQRLKPLDVID
jgi:dihydroflavonol-4-reductase